MTQLGDLMSQLLGNVINSFLLLRDFFGYLLPGAVFVGAQYFSLRPVDAPLIPGLSNWIIAIAASYLCGHILAAIGYGAFKFFDKFKKLFVSDKKYTELYDPKFLYYRDLYPQLYIEVDRQDTISILRVTLSASLLISWWWMPPALGTPMWMSGLLLLASSYLQYDKLRREIRPQTVEAARALDIRKAFIDADGEGAAP